MFTKIFLTLLTGVAIGIALYLAGCSSDSSKNASDLSNADTAAALSLAAAPAAASDQSTPARMAMVTEPIRPTKQPLIANNIEIYDILLKDNLVYGILYSGVLVHNLADGRNHLIPTTDPVNAITEFNGRILVGSDNIYTIKGESLGTDEYSLDLPGTITVLESKDSALLIGTSEGFYQMDGKTVRQLASSIYVSAIVPTPTGVWVGTAGEGLYFWNGSEFQKRFLQRDSTLFDNVTALQFSRDHLYLGTDHGLFVHDGGRWQQYTTADGLPSDLITAVNANDWTVRIGTAEGAVSLYMGELTPLVQFDGVTVNRFIRYHNGLLAATSNCGLVLKSGALATVLFDGHADSREVVLEED